MGRVAILARLSMCVLLVLSLQNAAQGARELSAHVQDDDLLPCQFSWQLPGLDCIAPATDPLPPCYFNLRRPRIDCWPQGPPLAHVAASATPVAASATPSAHVQGELPPCKNVPGGIPGWDCFDPPTTPLPPCDFKHQRPGFDCWPKSPPAAKVTSVMEISGAGGASTHEDGSSTTDQSAHHVVDGMLPPCGDVWGGIPGWDCYDPPKSPLPLCDFKHQRVGFDCWPKSPPAAKATVTDISAAGSASTYDQSAHHVDGVLPRCKDVPGGIQGWDCFDPPSTPLPPCDFKHQSPGIDCWPRDPPSAP